MMIMSGVGGWLLNCCNDGWMYGMGIDAGVGSDIGIGIARYLFVYTAMQCYTPPECHGKSACPHHKENRFAIAHY
jgi:hypothetical protein